MGHPVQGYNSPIIAHLRSCEVVIAVRGYFFPIIAHLRSGEVFIAVRGY